MSDAHALSELPAPQRQPFLALLSDARLAKLAAEGSTAAFSAIYRRHHQPLYRYCRSILGNEHEASDALQETMLKAMRALEGEEREIALKPWLFRIAHNEAIAIVRRRRPEQPLERADSIAAVDAGPEVRERLRGLIGDLERLTPRQRSALVMRELSGLGFDEIATALETSPEAVKTTVYEARLALHEFEAGREMTCDEVRRKVSDGDGRVLRGRAIRAHFATCSGCDGFAQALRHRRGQLSAIATPLPAPAAAAILSRILEGGGAGGLAVLAGGGGAAGLGAGAALKLGVAGVLVVGATTVGLEVGPVGKGAGVAEPAAASKPATAPERATNRAALAPAGPGAARASQQGGQGRGDEEKHGSAQTNPGGYTPGASGPPGSSAAVEGTGPASLPPGFGGAVPGQGGDPPGLGAPAPGQGGALPEPAGAAAANGPSEQVLSAPGQTGTTRGQSGSTPADDRRPLE